MSSNKMSAEKKGVIAFALIKWRMKKEGVRYNRAELDREIGNLSRDTGVSKEGLIAFFEELTRELHEECFPQ